MFVVCFLEKRERRENEKKTERETNKSSCVFTVLWLQLSFLEGGSQQNPDHMEFLWNSR